ncbi:MexH family multidrug efflux RND transporter periplasmic adaptor subunit [Brevundimonas denitrificans]|uniref:MexH family multidrug efflux RND transporter periplasmic adaptor subunit n=1 Tax=Brevundimonas denitrificans TaxID=1443434 RepID=A0ABQ6BHX8_9CAUL|nr:efflux RND transporter periplasmic adaptor subunit [Brevundimonas denitrificans]GLS01603.1 MexH family multidrug efflux RND transporter periplasmic adaptor subunit [Brevundimonas denitrificans]
MIKRHFFLVAAAVLLGLMIVAVVLRMAFAGDEKAGGGPGGRGGPGGGRGQTVSEAVIGSRSFTDEIRVLGVARGRRSVNITSSTSELITRVLFTDGQRVSAGTPLVELQAREEDAGIIEARAEVAQAQRQFDRYKTLADRGIAPRVTAEDAETALATARASLTAAQARRGDRLIRAPFAGVLGLSSVTAGTLVNPGGVITTLDDIDVVRVDFPVPERYLGVLRAGTPIRATIDAYGDEAFGGRIALIDTRINEQTRAVTARAEIPNPGARIRPGMAVRVAVQQGQRTAPAAPEAAVQYEGDGAFVYRIARGDRGSTAQRVEVETGSVEGGFVEILSGLNVGDRIVGSGLNRIQPGAPVRVAGQGGGQGGGRPAAAAAPARGAAQ